MKICRLSSEDIPALQRVCALINDFENSSTESSDIAWHNFLSDSRNCVWGVFADRNQLVGKILLKPDLRYPKHALLGGLWVSETLRRRGVGSLLIEETFKEAETQGYSMIKLWVSESNSEAFQFYQKFGFSPTGRLRSVAYDPFDHMQQLVLNMEQNATLPY
ncbi:MAG: GNAT family N-acetyltransferase [Verrucomicrobiota bacterium]